MKVLKLVVFFLGVTLGCIAQAPTINAFPVGSATIPPYSGATGTTMSITGTNFTGATAVSFGGTPASSFTVVSSTQITAVVAGGSSGNVSVTTPAGTANRAGFTYLPLSRIVSDFGGYWSTTTASASTTVPDNSHNLLGFNYNSTFYSTGVNDGTLTSRGISYTAGNFRSLPLAGITGSNPAGSSVYLAMAAKVDGNASAGSVSGVASSTIRSVMTDGTRGLDLGTGVTNIPSSAIMTFNIFSIDNTKITDAEPDILITQIADPSAGNDVFTFINSSGVTVGTSVTQDMTVLTSFGSYSLDLFSLPAGTAYNIANPSAVSSSNVTRSIRVVAFKLSDFGITSANVSNIKALKITPSGNSDYAFIAYNANAINIPPNISQNDASTTSTLCANSTAVLATIGAAASGGALTYSWERSTNGGTTWSAVTDGGNFSGAATSTLSIINPVDADKYRATVTESSSGYSNTSAVFTLTVSAVPVGGTVAGNATVCTGTNSTTLTLSGYTGTILKWQSSTDNFNSNSTVSNTTTSLTATDLTATTQYRAVIKSGSCTNANSTKGTVTVSPVSVGGSVDGSATVCPGSNSTILTLNGNTGSVVKWQSSTDNFSSVITDIANTTTSLTVTNLAAATQYRAVVQSGSCAIDYSSAATITIGTGSVGGSIAGSASVCSGSNSTSLTLSGYTGTIIKWQSSTDNFSSVVNDVANTTNSLTATNLTATTQYRAVIQNGSCNTANSATATVTITTGSVGGSIAGSATVCTGTNSTSLTLSGHTGSIVKWQSSTDNFSSVVTDVSNTTTGLTATNLTATTTYRAVVQFNSCASANSSTASVTVSPATIGGSIASDATVCTGTNSTALTLSGHTGSIIRWESSTDNFNNKTNITNTTTAYTATNILATTMYRAVIKSGSCSSTNSARATLTVTPVSVGGSVSGSASVCPGTNSTTFTLSGYTGSIVKWQSSTDNFSTVINDITNTTITLTATNLSATTQYRAVVQNGPCSSDNSSVATVTVNPASSGGSIAGSATVCTGTNSTTLTVSGYTGSIVKWQSSTDNFSSVITDIANTTTTLTATNLTATTKYRAVVQSGSCSSANSALATVTVNPVSAGGFVAGSATVCTGTNSTTLTLSGYTGSVIKWQSSTDNFSSVINDISNTTTTLTATNLSATTQYRAVVQSGSCSSANSSVATVTVNPASSGGSIAGSATVCSGTNSTTLTLSGYTGSIVKWQSSTDNFSSVINDITNTTTSLTATNLTATTKYRAVVQSGSCSSANSALATVTVNPVSAGGTVSGGATVCTGTNSTTLTLSGYTGSIIKWQSSTDNFSSVINDVSNTTTTLTATNLSATTQYRAVVQSGSCSSANSSVAAVIISPASAGGTISGSATICSGTNSTTLTLSGYTGSIVKWQSSTDNFSSVITDIANATTTLTATNLSATTKYRAVVQSGSCSSANSSVASVTIATGQWIGGTTGDWNNAANWCGGVPTSSTNISIPANTTVYIQSNNGAVNSVSIATNATIVMTGNYNLVITAGGTFTNNGTFDASGSTGTVSFLGNGTISGTTTFQNIETAGALDFGTDATVAGEFTIQTGGSVTGNAPTYTCPGSTLTYNTGSVYPRGMEWPSVSSGKGLPSNVKVKNSTTINFPAAGAGYVCNDLTIENGSSLYQNYSGSSAPLTVGRHVNISGTLSLGNSTGDDITLGGNWTRNSGGVFNSNGRTVTFNGSSNATITAPASSSRDANGAFGGETFYNVNINKSSSSNTVALASNLSVTNELKVTKGIFDLADNDVTVVSGSSSTAHVAAVPASGAAIRYGGSGNTGAGRFVIQRHLAIGTGSASRRWRLLTAPIQSSGAPSLNTAWQEGVSNSDRNSPIDPSPGFGTIITKSTTYSSTDGFDQGSTTSPSIYTYSTSSGWTVPSSTKAGAITDKEGYMIFIRGDRSIVVSTPTINASPTILEPKGKINVGNVQKNLVTGQQVIGNPYASAINFGKATLDNYTLGGTTFNNTTAGSSGGVGITYYIFDPKTSGTSGVGKFITCSSNGDGTFTVSGNSSGLPTDGTIQSGAAFMISAENTGGTLTFHEGDKINSSSTTGMASRSSAAPNIISSLATNLFSGTGTGAALADGVVNAYDDSYLNEVTSQDAAKLGSFNSKEGLSILRDTKSLAIERRNVITTNDTIFLKMTNLNKATYSFQFIPKNLDASLSAVLEDKFTGIAKPVSLTDTTSIAFDITNDANSAATDRFRIVFKQSAALVSKSAKPTKQNPQAVNVEAIRTGITVYPNPVTNGNIMLQLSNMPAGNYQLKVINSLGQAVSSMVVKLNGSTASQATISAEKLNSGIYLLKLSNGNKIYTQTVMVAK